MLQSGGDAGVNQPVSVLKLQTTEDARVDEDVQDKWESALRKFQR